MADHISRRAFGLSAALGGCASLAMPPKLLRAQDRFVGPDWLLPDTKYVVVSCHPYFQDNSTGGWRILRPVELGSDPPQASSGGLLPNTLVADHKFLPSRISAVVDELLSTPRRQPPLINLTNKPRDRTTTPQEYLRHLLFIQIFVYIRDLSGDLVFPPPSRVASVMRNEIVRFVRDRNQTVVQEPRTTVHTVTRATATEWFLEELDASVRRIMAPLI